MRLIPVRPFALVPTLPGTPDQADGRMHERALRDFDRADERYNSGLFHFRPERGRAEPPDELTTRLALDDKPLKEIVRGLYYPDSPDEFSVLPAEIPSTGVPAVSAR